ncbi:MAG: hypothetical protein C0622_00015 [Desulfuromonas sp.]|nr:MAG: hypothetical protein C0622_00015 [Desulfuromonas sp.]
MNFLQGRSADIVSETLSWFGARIETEPAVVLEQAESELQTHYVRYGNDWTGRGYVGDSEQEAVIAALEAVRAECLERLQRKASNLRFE